MANLPESSTFDAGVYQLELTDPVIGGPSGVSNAPLKNLANRTKYLKDHVDALESGAVKTTGDQSVGGKKIFDQFYSLGQINFSGNISGYAEYVNRGAAAIGHRWYIGASGTDVGMTLEANGVLKTPYGAETLTQPAGTNNTKVATTAFVTNAVGTATAPLAPLASPALTGTPTAPTAAAGTNTTQLATTAFVAAAAAAIDAGNVKLTGNQSIAGEKSFANLVSTGQVNFSGAVGGFIEYVNRANTAAGHKWYVGANASLVGMTLGANGVLDLPYGGDTITQPVGTNNTKLATTAFVNYEISNDVGVANSPLVKAAMNAGGAAPVYACRAWVNFNGQGTPAIRASGNVSSIGDNGTGRFRINFATAMPDSSYSVHENHRGGSQTTGNDLEVLNPSYVDIFIGANGVVVDADIVCVSVFR